MNWEKQGVLFKLPLCKTVQFQCTYFYRTARLWNTLPFVIRDASSLQIWNCAIWIGCETAIWAVTSHAWLRTEGSVVDTHVLAADEPPRLTYTSVLSRYLYIQHKKISNQLIYSLSLGLFFLQSNIAYVVLLSIFRLRDSYIWADISRCILGL